MNICGTSFCMETKKKEKLKHTRIKSFTPVSMVRTKLKMRKKYWNFSRKNFEKRFLQNQREEKTHYFYLLISIQKEFKNQKAKHLAGSSKNLQIKSFILFI